MGVLQAIFLGVLQGLTEFLPVSSSGHLVIAQQLLPGGVDHALAFDVCLHFGTLVAVVAYFRDDLFAMARSVIHVDPEQPHMRTWIVLLGIATIPIVVVGLTLREPLEEAFNSLTAVGSALLVTALLLTLASQLSGRGNKGPGNITIVDAIVIGLFQALAVVPGISRAGSTITGGFLRGVAPDAAARFAFLLSLPAIMGAVVLNFQGVSELLRHDAVPAVAGMLAAGVTGWLAIDLMMRAVRLGRLAPFAIYCAVLGTVTLLMGLV